MGVIKAACSYDASLKFPGKMYERGAKGEHDVLAGMQRLFIALNEIGQILHWVFAESEKNLDIFKLLTHLFDNNMATEPILRGDVECDVECVSGNATGTGAGSATAAVCGEVQCDVDCVTGSDTGDVVDVDSGAVGAVECGTDSNGSIGLSQSSGAAAEEVEHGTGSNGSIPAGKRTSSTL
jgi:hypothetical protein